VLYILGMAIRNHLRRFRFEAGDLTQQDLADRVGVTRQTVLSIEKGHHVPSVELALRFAHALGTTVEQLFEVDDEAPREARS